MGMLLRWTAAAFTAMALAGLLTRLAPGTFTISAGFLPERIAFPITYWNAMGIACAMASCSRSTSAQVVRSTRFSASLAAAALPMLGVTLYLTFSRGAIWALPVGLVLYVLLAQPRGLATALPVAAIPALVASRWPTAPSCWRGRTTTRPRPRRRRRHVGLVLIACVAAAAALRGRAILARPAARSACPCRRARGWSSWPGRSSCSWPAALAVHAPQKLNNARETFARASYLSSTDLRERLTSAVDNGRVDNWRVALDGFKREPAARHRRGHLPAHAGSATARRRR